MKPASSTGLHPFAVALLECITPAAVVDAVVGVGVSVLGARAGLVALVSEDRCWLEVVGHAGYPDTVLDGWQRFAVDAPLPLSDAVRENAVLLFTGKADWQARYPQMVEQTPAGIFQASVSMPLSARGLIFGGLHFSFPSERVFSSDDEEFLLDLSRQCAMALDRALLLDRAERALEQAQAANQRLALLARAGILLGESFDYRARLEALVRLCVPEMCDWATVDVERSGALLNVAVAHRLRDREAAMCEIQKRYPAEKSPGPSALTVIQTGRRLFFPDIPEADITAHIGDAEHVRLLNLVGIRSVLILPLSARGNNLGALTLGMGPEPAGTGRGFTPETVALAEDVARRAGAAIDNALLYEQSQREIAGREAALCAAETAHHRVEVVLESIGEMFYALDSEFRFTYVNRRLEEVCRTPRNDLLGRCLWDMFPQTQGGEGSEQQIQVMRSRRAAHFETVSRVLGRWVESHVYPSEDGGISVYVRDISDRKQAQEELARRESEYAALVDNAPDVLARIGADLRILYVNRAVVRLTGISAEELVGKLASELAAAFPDKFGRWGEAVKGVFATGRALQRLEFSFSRPSGGGVVYVEVSLTPELDREGRVVSVIAVTHDISERVAGERAVLEAAQKQRQFLREMLSGFTDGRLKLCFALEELPTPLEPMMEPFALSHTGLSVLRGRVETIARTIGLPPDRTADLVTAVHEAGMNAVRHAGGGLAQVYGDVALCRIQVWVQDHGPGIAEDMIHRAVERGFTTGGFGQGFYLMQSCADRLYLYTGRAGTTIVLEQDRKQPEPEWLK